MRILGLSAYYHDSAAALVEDGKIVAAAQEERFSRKKHDARFPREAITYCLAEADCTLDEIDRVVFYDKPLLKFERLLATALAFAPSGFASFRRSMPVWLGEKLFFRRMLTRELTAIAPRFPAAERLLFSEHHLSHAASAFFPSPFDDAAILTLDGVGEWTTTSIAHGRSNAIETLREIHFPHSLGLLYSAFTDFIGFKVNSGEYKLMGLAPLGEPRFADIIRAHLIDLREDGSFRLDQRYFDYCGGLTMTNARFAALFGTQQRSSDEPLGQHHMDLAASIQLVIEEAVLKLARTAARETRSRNLCLAGGVALNCVANGRLLREGPFDNIWVQPAAGDAGGALGAALAAYHIAENQPRIVDGRTDAMQGALLGPGFEPEDIERRLHAAGARFAVLDEVQLLDQTARALADGKVVGWMQGRMEFGPRALGARSILADPRSPTMQARLNKAVKNRETFRPFAPAIPREQLSQWFDLERASPYMQFVAQVLDGGQGKADRDLDLGEVARVGLPAVTHADGSARVQSVDVADNPRFHALLRLFGELTNCPVLLNTSFNVRGEPLVNTPEDAFRCFMGTGLDMLVAGNCLLIKQDQNSKLGQDHWYAFEPD
jgi:carbamoyltransferase